MVMVSVCDQCHTRSAPIHGYFDRFQKCRCGNEMKPLELIKPHKKEYCGAKVVFPISTVSTQKGWRVFYEDVYVIITAKEKPTLLFWQREKHFIHPHLSREETKRCAICKKHGIKFSSKPPETEVLFHLCDILGG